MLFNFKAPKLGFAILCGVVPVLLGECPGSLGDSYCVLNAGSGSFCVPGFYTCQGAPNLDCGCDFTAAAGTTVSTVPPGTSSATSRTRGRTLQSRTGPAVTTSSPSAAGTSTVAPTTSASVPATLAAPVPSACGSSPSQPLFVWAEWPTLNGAAEWTEYYQKMLGLVMGNCGNFRITELIVRVTDPSIADLWGVSRNSVFYTAFLSQLPSSVTLKLYPYLLTSNAQAVWSSWAASVSAPLEGVFRFASEWNKISSGVKFSGVVVDGEEKVGFLADLPNLSMWKNLYSIGSFGVAIGYDATGQVASYPGADEFYIELYDFYVNNAPSLTLVQVNAANGTPSQFVNDLVQKVLDPFVSKYSDTRFKFMWSVQAKSSQSCAFPLGAGCGSSDDFGLFSAPAFNQFLQLIQTQYPVFTGRSHGIFQFNFIPPSWF